MKRYLSFACGIIIVIGYLLFTALALINFPGPFSPLRNWLSDLGSSQLNPQGAVFYNLGIILVGAVILPFFLGLRGWAIQSNKIQKTMLFLTQLFGCLGALAMMLSAVFPINFNQVHGVLSTLLYILLGTAFAFSVAALRYYPRYPRWLLALGILIAIEDMVWGEVLNVYLMEFVTVFLFLGYVLLLGVETQRQTIYAIEG